MAVTYGFFNSVNGDRKYNAEQMSEYFRGIINEGVYQHLDGGLAVTAGTGLAVNVAAGRAIIQNRWIQNSAAMSLTIAAASETYARKDAVVIRLNWSSRSISIAVKTGTPAASPVAPSMTRNSTTYEMALAYVNVAANATSVTVTDKRSDSTVCGWVTVAQSTSGEVDAQLNAMKTGFDGVEYSSPEAAILAQFNIVKTSMEQNDDIPYFSPGFSMNISYSGGNAVFSITTTDGKINYLTAWQGNRVKNISVIPDTCSCASVNGNTVTFTIPNGWSIYWDNQNFVVKDIQIGNVPKFWCYELLSARYNQVVSGAWLVMYNHYQVTKVLPTSDNNIKAMFPVSKNVPYFSNGATFEVIKRGSTGIVEFVINTTNGLVAFINDAGGSHNESISSISTDVSFASVSGNKLTFACPANVSLYWDSIEYKVKQCIPGNIPHNYPELLTIRYLTIVSGIWATVYNLYVTDENTKQLKTLETDFESEYVSAGNADLSGLDTYLGIKASVSDNNYDGIFFTDPHFYFSQKSNYPNTIITNMQKAFVIGNSDEVVCGGDILNTSAITKEVARWQLSHFSGLCRRLFDRQYHFALGNHDTNIYSPAEGDQSLSYDEIARLMVNEYAANLYYSYETRCAKVVVLNSGDQTSSSDANVLYSQLGWLHDELVASDKPVIIYIHAMWIDSANYDLFSATQALMDFFEANNNKTSIVINNTTYDFSGSSVKVECVLSGHIHEYHMEYINDIPVICGDNMSASGEFYYIICDFDNKKLHVIDNHNNTSVNYDVP